MPPTRSTRVPLEHTRAPPEATPPPADAPPPGFTRVCAVVVTFHPDADLGQRLARVRAQVGGLIVVDNGSGENADATLHRLESGGAIVVRNHSNLGVARALNIGIARASERGFAWLLLLDQDSDVEPDLVRSLFDALNACPFRDTVAVIGARFTDVHTGVDDSRRPAGARPPAGAQLWEEVEAVITSGSLIPLAALRQLGDFREELFIDSVDLDYCYRARARGWHVIKTRRTLMSHAIGASTRHRVLGLITKWTSNHSADRRYYFARNDTVMLREYGGYRFGGWLLKSLVRRLRACKRILLYEDGKAAKVSAVLAGLRDGVRGRLGPRHGTLRPRQDSLGSGQDSPDPRHDDPEPHHHPLDPRQGGPGPR